MDVARMRWFDRWLGVPACAALTGLRRLADLVQPKPGGQPRRVVFVKLAEQGTAVLAHAAIRKAVQKVGRENVFFLVFEENRFILEVMEVIPAENVLTIDSTSLFSAVASGLRAVRRMRAERIDAAIDLEFFARSSAALSYLSGAKRRVGFHAFGGEASYRGDLMTHRLSFNPFLHASQTFQMQVEALSVPADKLPAFNMTGPPVDEFLPEFQPLAEEAGAVKRSLQQALGQRTVTPLILLNANCSDLLPLRRWPADRYVELARRLLERYPQVRIAFTGAPEEAGAARRLAAQTGSDRCVSMAGRTTLRQLLALYCLADVLVTNDSGPAHFASLTPIDVVTLFGPETPAVFAARSLRSHVLWSGLVCSPCISAYNDRRSSCRDNLCMQGISVDQVFEQVCRIHDRRGERGAGKA